jgi:phage terminase large subunit-like protein
MPAGVWEKGDVSFDKEALKGKRCFGGLDLSNKWDLTAFVLVFPPQDDIERYILLPTFFCPEDSIKLRSRTDAVHYEIWQQQGFITATPGNVIDEAFIKQAIIDADSLYHIDEIGFDPWNATALSVDLFNNHGFVKPDGKSRLVEMRQGFKTLSEPTKDLRAKAMQGRIAHGGHPVLSWNVDNMVVRQDANENVAPDKDKATERIDGAVAAVMGWGRMIFNDNEESVYSGRGIYVLDGSKDE